MAGSDQCAIGLLIELRRAGVDVPGRVSIVGYDDIRSARLAVQAAVERLDDGPGPGREAREFSLAPRLVVRGTTTGPAT